MARPSFPSGVHAGRRGTVGAGQLSLFASDDYLTAFHARLRDLDELTGELRRSQREFIADQMTRWPCPVCAGMPVPEPGFDQGHPLIETYSGADPCLGWLPGVAFACCGHDREPPDDAYVVIPGRGTWHGDEAKTIMRSLGGNPP